MAASERELKKGEYLFREGDASDAVYMVRSGTMIIAKQKGNSEIEIASVNAGQMFGEMAFFDNKPRSANARAGSDCSVIVLPFDNLNQQFATFPVWLKVMVKTVNENLREATKRIKNLEQNTAQNSVPFPPHLITKLSSILTFVALRFGQKEANGDVLINGAALRNYTIQVFQEPTGKMQKLTEIFQTLGFLKIEDLADQRTQVRISQLDFISSFTDFYNRWLFTEESKRTLVTAADLKFLQALVEFGKTEADDSKGRRKINLTLVQQEASARLGYPVPLTGWAEVIEKKLCSDQMSSSDGIFVTCDYNEIARITSYWRVVYAIEAGEPRARAKQSA